MITAFKGDPKLKAKYLDRVQKHYDADEIIQGTYWEKGKGCAVGCTLEYDNSGPVNIHQRMEDELGIPRMIARLEDRIFEGLTNGDAKKFPMEFLQAITPGANLSLVVPKFFVWLLVDTKDGIIKYAREDGKKAIQKVADLYKEKIAGKEVKTETWKKAAAYAAAAAAAAADAADAAADAAYAAYAAAYAAYAAAYAAYAAAAADAADAAAAAAEWKVAKEKYYRKMADKLLELLREAK